MNVKFVLLLSIRRVTTFYGNLRHLCIKHCSLLLSDFVGILVALRGYFSDEEVTKSWILIPEQNKHQNEQLFHIYLELDASF